MILASSDVTAAFTRVLGKSGQEGNVEGKDCVLKYPKEIKFFCSCSMRLK